MARDVTDNELKPQQRRLIEALLLGASMEDAAEQVGTSRRTAYRWAALPAFKAELTRLDQENLQRVLRAMSTGARRAVAVLAKNMQEPASPGTQVRAALGLLDQYVKLKEYSELEARIVALEARYSEKAGDR